jgi:hypothetical protein
MALKWLQLRFFVHFFTLCTESMGKVETKRLVVMVMGRLFIESRCVDFEGPKMIDLNV